MGKIKCNACGKGSIFLGICADCGDDSNASPLTESEIDAFLGNVQMEARAGLMYRIGCDGDLLAEMSVNEETW